jgi:TRAP-type C4-dicarboxylate transport system permease small subunit
MRRVIATIDAAIMCVVVVLWALFFVCVVAQVFVRYVLELPLPWTDEVARYTFIWSSFLSASVILGRGQHFSIDVVVGRLPRHAVWVIELIGTGLCLAFTLVLTQKSAAWAWRLSYARSSVLELPLGVVYAVLPFSASFMSIHLIGRLVGLLNRGAAGRRPSW